MFKTGVRRRTILLTSSGAILAGLAAPGWAATLTGIDALDTPSDRVKSPEAVSLQAIALAGERLVAVGEHGVILYSDDSGSTWKQADVPVNVVLTCVQFASAKIGWAAGHFGVVLKTLDGGASWAVQMNGVQVNQLTMQAAQSIDAATSTSPAAPVALRRANAFVASGPSKPFLSLIVLSAQEAFVFGAYRMALVTRDGGATWNEWSLHVEDKISHNLYAASVIGSSIYLAGEAGEVFRSSDQGATFRAVTSPSPTTLFGIVGVKDSWVVTFGVAGVAFRSADQGQSWSPITLPTQDNISAGIVTASGVTLLVCETGTVFMSKTDGKDFAHVEGTPTVAVFGLAQAPDGNLVLVGESGITRVPATILNS